MKSVQSLMGYRAVLIIFLALS